MNSLLEAHPVISLAVKETRTQLSFSGFVGFRTRSPGIFITFGAWYWRKRRRNAHRWMRSYHGGITGNGGNRTSCAGRCACCTTGGTFSGTTICNDGKKNMGFCSLLFLTTFTRHLSLYATQWMYGGGNDCPANRHYERVGGHSLSDTQNTSC